VWKTVPEKIAAGESGNVAGVAKTLNERPLPLAVAAGTKQFLSPVSSIGQSI
jgi:hypothetical protein